MREITKIESTVIRPVRRKRVAAYARVSTGHDAQLHSLSAQISYYNNYIGSRGDWELVGIYTDAAMTGTKDDRPGFQKLLSDCRAGLIDMVIVKSITRLARNTVTLLSTARELNTLGIDIYFEKENIHTLSTDGELMLTLLASFAQEESRSVSENIKWSVRKKFEQGLLFGGSPMLGYYVKAGALHVIPEEAEIVKQIFRDYLSGLGIAAIAKKLNRQGIPSKTGGLWNESTINKTLKNERYTGNLLLQKTYHKDHISKKTVKNNGEIPMYFVKNSHPAIIDQETFDKVQEEIKRRAVKYSFPKKSTEPYPFTGLLRCSLCDRRFKRRVYNRHRRTLQIMWACSTYASIGKEFCPAPLVPEWVLYEKTSEILGTDDWDRKTLLKIIKKIEVLEVGLLRYVFWDGAMREVRWQSQSHKKMQGKQPTLKHKTIKTKRRRK